MNEGERRPARPGSRLNRITRSVEAAAARVPFELTIVLILIGLQAILGFLGILLAVQEGGPGVPPLALAGAAAIAWLVVLFAGIWARKLWAWWAGTLTFWTLTLVCLGGGVHSVGNVIWGDEEAVDRAFEASLMFLGGFGLFGTPAGLLLTCRRRYFVRRPPP